LAHRLAADHWNRPLSKTMTAAAHASYPAYILHPPVLVALSAAIAALAWPPEIKFIVVAAFGVPACFGLGYLATPHGA
jgi:peptidoglycan/LPS O-acetylase OafA/YrhL